MKTLIVLITFWMQVLSPVALAGRNPASEQSLYLSMHVQDIWSFQGPLSLMGSERVVTTAAFLENTVSGQKKTMQPQKEIRSFESEMTFLSPVQAQYKSIQGEKVNMRLKTKASLYTGIKSLDLQPLDAEKIIVPSLDRQVQKAMNEFLVFQDHNLLEKQRSVTNYRCSRVQSALICSGQIQIEYRLLKKASLAQR